MINPNKRIFAGNSWLLASVFDGLDLNRETRAGAMDRANASIESRQTARRKEGSLL